MNEKKPKIADKILENQTSDKLARFRRSLKTARDLQDIKLAMGVKGIELYVEDVEGDWLERWGEDNNTEEALKD